MRRGISAFADYDQTGRWMTLDEIWEAAREHEWDFYPLVLDCYHDPFDGQEFVGNEMGDRVILYRTDLLKEEGEADG